MALCRFLQKLTAVLLAVLLATALGAVIPGGMSRVCASAPELAPEKLRPFLSQTVEKKRTEHGIPGVVVVVVVDGELAFAEGFGTADIATGRPVDAAHTGFVIGSVTKLFTATAVMQQVEAGRLELQADVDDYVNRFALDNPFDVPVTLHHLLTHTAGFDDSYLGMSTDNRAEVRPLGKFLARKMPPVVLRPGSVISYSNYGMSLAGLLVENAAGKPYVEYVEKHLLKPLEMHSTGYYPGPEQARRLATGYSCSGGECSELELLFSQTVPAGGIRATGTDMAHFMIMQLNGGVYQGRQLLKPTTVQQLHSQQFTHHPELAGMAYGFHEYWQNGQRVLLHGGEEAGFASLLALIPAHEVGFFLSSNAREGAALRQEVLRAFIDRFFPQEARPAPEPIAGHQERAERYAGYYRYNRYDRNSVAKLLGALGEIKVESNDDGTLTIPGPDGSRANYVEVEPLLFQLDGDRVVAFGEDHRGRITHLFNGTYALRRLPWFASGRVHAYVLGGTLFVFLAALLAWGGGRLYRLVRRRGEVRGDRRALRKRAQLALGAAALLNVACVAALLLGFDWLYYEFIQGVPTVLYLLLMLPLLSAALTLVGCYFVLLMWLFGVDSLPGRTWHSVVCIAGLVFLAVLAYWNLLGFQLG